MNQKGFVNIILIVVVIAIIISGAYFIFSKKSTTDWKTYTNSQYGFELRCPNNWVEKFSQNSNGSYITGVNIIYLGVGPTKSLLDGQRLSIEVIGQSEENYIKSLTNQIRKIVSQEEIQLGAVKGKHYRFSDSMVDTLDASTYYFDVFTITHNNLLYVINPVSYNSEITQILSTFKFTR